MACQSDMSGNCTQVNYCGNIDMFWNSRTNPEEGDSVEVVIEKLALDTIEQAGEIFRENHVDGRMFSVLSEKALSEMGLGFFLSFMLKNPPSVVIEKGRELLRRVEAMPEQVMTPPSGTSDEVQKLFGITESASMAMKETAAQMRGELAGEEMTAYNSQDLHQRLRADITSRLREELIPVRGDEVVDVIKKLGVEGTEIATVFRGQHVDGAVFITMNEADFCGIGLNSYYAFGLSSLRRILEVVNSI